MVVAILSQNSLFRSLPLFGIFALLHVCNVLSVVGDGGEPLIIENDMLRLVTE